MKNSNRIQKKWAVASFMIGTLSLGLSAHADDANMKSEDIYIGQTKVNVVYQKKSDTKIEVAAPVVTEGRVCETCDDKLYTLNVQANDFNDIKKLDGMLMQQIYSSGGSSQVPHPPQQDVAAAPQAPAAPAQSDINDRLGRVLQRCIDDNRSIALDRVNCLSDAYIDILKPKHGKISPVSPEVALDAFKTMIEPQFEKIFMITPIYNKAQESIALSYFLQTQGRQEIPDPAEINRKNSVNNAILKLVSIMADAPLNMTDIRNEIISFEKKILTEKAQLIKAYLVIEKARKNNKTDGPVNFFIYKQQEDYANIMNQFECMTNPSPNLSQCNKYGDAGMAMAEAVDIHHISTDDAGSLYQENYKPTVKKLTNGTFNSFKINGSAQLVSIDPDQIPVEAANNVVVDFDDSNQAPGGAATGQVQKVPGFNGVPGGVKPKKP